MNSTPANTLTIQQIALSLLSSTHGTDQQNSLLAIYTAISADLARDNISYGSLRWEKSFCQRVTQILHHPRSLSTNAVEAAHRIAIPILYDRKLAIETLAKGVTAHLVAEISVCLAEGAQILYRAISGSPRGEELKTYLT